MEVGPTCHYIMGGVRVDAETGASRVEGLFAAGECAGGLSGATRLGGNSLSDLLVFGRRAGVAAAEYATTASGGEIDDDDVGRRRRTSSTRFLSPTATRIRTPCTRSSSRRCSGTSASTATRPD